MPLANGEVFAGYRILRTLGLGGMGEVYLAEHPRLPRHDALKILPAEMSADHEFRERFNREAELAATLYHPHIVGVHDRGEFNGQLWISMDYIDGPDAGRLQREYYPAGMPPGEVVDILTGVADALDYAHDRGLLHRDVKPPNILLTTPARGRRRVLLADFGIARNAAEVSGLTDTNVTLGTVNYAAPEQLMGAALDGRADQYALAATAYHLLTGAPMFGSSNPAVVISRHLNSPPPLLADTHPALAALDPVLGRALAKKPDNRFRTCTDFARALGQAAVSRRPAAAGPPVMPPTPVVEHRTAVLTNALPAEPPPVAVIQRPPSRWPWAVAGIALLLILSALVFALWPRHEASTPSAAITTSTTRPFSTTSSTVAGAVTFDSMRDLVISFYSQLPADPMAAWAKLDAHYQDRNGMSDFLGFWSTIGSVTLLSVSPRDSTSVVARLRYVRRDGGVDTEDRWLSVVPKDGGLLIYDSERIGAA
jgi:serine/threonine-protein kinase